MRGVPGVNGDLDDRDGLDHLSGGAMASKWRRESPRRAATFASGDGGVTRVAASSPCRNASTGLFERGGFSVEIRDGVAFWKGDLVDVVQRYADSTRPGRASQSSCSRRSSTS